MDMHRRQLMLAAALAAAGTGARAQAGWPTRPLRLIVPFPPGGGTDFLSRTVASKLAEGTGWTVVPDNRAGAGGTIGIGEAARAENSGHTLVMGQLDNLVVAPQFYRALPYDTLRDLQPVAHVADSPIILLVAASSPFRTLADVAAAARQTPDAVTFASAGAGTVSHLVGEFFGVAAGVKLRHIPYRGSAPALADLLGGQVALLSSSIPSASAQLKAGKLRALGVSSARRSPAVPEVPTIAEQGFPDFDVATWYGVFAPIGVPAPVVQRVNAEINRLLQLPEVAAAIQSQGGDARPDTAQALGARVRRDTERWKAAIAAAGVKLELG